MIQKLPRYLDRIDDLMFCSEHRLVELFNQNKHRIIQCSPKSQVMRDELIWIKHLQELFH